MKYLLVAALALTSSACTWIELTEGGTGVSVMQSAPADCKRLGQTASMTKSDIASIDRNRDKVALELQTLARNAAANMGGNVVVAQGEISENGEQTFVIYKCGV